LFLFFFKVFVLASGKSFYIPDSLVSVYAKIVHVGRAYCGLKRFHLLERLHHARGNG
jgi:hypothetical protein